MKCFYENLPLVEALDNNNVALAKYLVDNGADVNEFDKHENNALLKACCISKTIVEFLVEKGASLDVKDYSDYSPMCIAADIGSSSLCHFLHEKKAKMNKKNDNDICIVALYLIKCLFLLRVLVD